jgi:hypothetical protein
MAKPISEELQALYAANSIPVDLQQYLQKEGILTAKNLANHCDQASEVFDTIIKAHGAHAQSNEVKINMKQCWREAMAQTQRGIKRTTEGLPEAPIDEPFADPVQKALNDSFMSKYSFDLPIYLRPSDSLLARVRREFERNTMSFYPINKVKSLKIVTRSSPDKRHRVTDRISMTFEGEEVVDEPTVRIRAAFLQLEILANAWGIAGCCVYQPPAPLGSSSTSQMSVQQLVCHWQQAVTYFRTLKDRCELLLDSFPESNVCSYFQQVEEAFRGHALEASLRRDCPLPWGMALEAALRDFPVIWSDFHAVLQSRSSKADHSLSSMGQIPVAPAAPTRLDKPAKQSNQSERGLLATCVVDNRGNKLCKAFNDRRTCASPCVKGHMHVCDIQLATGKCCGARHARGSHDPAVHGAWAVRKN